MRAPPSLPAKTTQHGAALLVMLVILVMGAMTFLVRSLSTSAQKTARQETTAQALAQAKEALIGRAAGNDNMPGSLPCPDTDNDGSAELFIANDCPSYIGRLPWRTLRLPDLRDDSGERLWYVLSPNFRDDNSARPLNSDTQGQLSIVGNITVSNVAAIVFAPDAPLCGKSHNSNNVADYLEAGDGTSTSYTLKSFSDDCNSPYNDNLLAITASQIFQPVEKRVGSEIKQILNSYYAAWGAFPFAAPFADPSNPLSFTGQATPAQYEGLLPVDDQSYLPTWVTAPTVSFSGGFISPMSCILSNGAASNSRWRCCDTGGSSTTCTSNNITIPAGVTVTITGTLNAVGRGFWRPHHVNNICEVRARTSSGTTVLATDLLDNVTVISSLNPNSSANITFSATAKSAGSTLRRIELRDIQSYNDPIQSYTNSSNCSSPPSTTSPVIPTWLLDNNWHQVSYYAVSPGYAPGGGNICNPCLTLNSSNNKRAAIVMTGGALAGQTHPQSTIAHYLEGENAVPIPPTPTDYIYENKAHTNTFNDQVIVVAP